jgi:tetratricopeptide (TPR) repeat protein
VPQNDKREKTVDKSETTPGIFVAPDLCDMVDRRKDYGRLHGRCEAARSLFRMLKGFMPSEVSCSVSDGLASHTYSLTIDDQKVDGGVIPPSGSVLLYLEGGKPGEDHEEIYESFTGLPCLWTSPKSDVPPQGRRFLELLGMDILAHHLFQMMSHCASHLFDSEAFAGWKDHPDFPPLGEMFAGGEKELLLFDTLKMLLSMGLPLYDRVALHDELRRLPSAPSAPPHLLAESLRRPFARRLAMEHAVGKGSHAFYPDSRFTEKARAFMSSRLNLATLFFQKDFVSLLMTLGKALFPAIDRHGIPLLICSRDIRLFMEMATMQIFPELHIFSLDEIDGMEPLERTVISAPGHSSGAESIHSINVDALHWSRSRFSYFMKKRQKGSLFYHVAPLKPDDFLLSSMQSMFLFIDGRTREASSMIGRALKQAPTRFLPCHIKGEQLVMAGYPNKGLPFLAKALAAEPCYAAMLGERARELFIKGDTGISRRLLELCLQLDEDNSRNLGTLAEMMKAEGKREDAEKMLDRALKIAPHNYRAWRLLAWLHIEKGDHEKAEECFKSLLSLAPADPLGRYGLGTIYFHQKRLKEAEWEFHHALQGDPDMDWAHYRLGWLHFQQGKLSLAEQKFLKALELSPERAEFGLGLAALYRQQKAHGQAIDLLKGILRREPGHIKAREALAETCWEMGDHAHALEEYQSLLFICPEEVMYHYASGLLHLDLGRPKEAEKELRWSARRTPGFPAALEAHGWALITAGEPRKAERAFTDALALHPNQQGLWYGLGAALFHAGDLEKAADMMRKSLGNDNPWPHYMLGRIMDAAGKRSEALDSIMKARELDPHNVSFRYEEADQLFRRGALREALERARELIEGSPDHWQAHVLLGRILKKMDDPRGAEAQWRRSIDLFPLQGAFYGELFFLFEEEGDYSRMIEFTARMRKALPLDPVTPLLDLLLKLDCLQLEEAEIGFKALLNQKTHAGQAHSYLALIEFLRKDFKKAYAHAGRARRERGTAMVRDSYLGELYAITGRTGYYEAQCLAHLKKHGEDLQVERALAEFYLRRGRYRKSHDLLRKILRKDRRAPRAHAILAELQFRQGRFKDAQATLEEGIRLFPMNPELHAKMGQLNCERGLQSQGERSFRVAISRSPERIALLYHLNLLGYRGCWEEIIELFPGLPEPLNNSCNALSLAALALAQLKRYDEALEKLALAELSLVDRYDKAEIAYSFAIIHWMRNSDEEAIKAFTRAKKLSPGTGSASLAGAFIHFLRGELRRASEELLRARRRRPEWAEACFLTGLVIAQEGNRRRGTYYLEKALSLFPRNTIYGEWLERIRQVKNAQ